MMAQSRPYYAPWIDDPDTEDDRPSDELIEAMIRVFEKRQQEKKLK
jgi:hypothetical protein